MASSSSSTTTSSSTTSNSNPASAPAPSAADGAHHPANPALPSVADGPDHLAAPCGPAASSSTSSPTTSNSIPASALAPSAADGAHHPPSPALSAADGPKLQAAPSDPASSSSTASNVSKDARPALPTIALKGVGRGAAPPATASASCTSTFPSLGAAASSSRAAARLPTTTYETDWGGKGRVPPANTGLDLLRRRRNPRIPMNNSSRDRASSSKAARGGYEGWEAAPNPTSSTPPKKAWTNLAWSNSMSAASTGAPTGACFSTHPSLLTKFAGHDTSQSSSSGAAASFTASAAPSTYTPAPAAPPSTSVQLAPVQASPSSAPSLSDTFDWTINNYRGPGRGVLRVGAFTAGAGGNDTAVAAEAIRNYDGWYASDGTIEELRQKASVDLGSLFPDPDDAVLGHVPERQQPVGSERKRCFDCSVNRAERSFSPCGHIVLCRPCYDRRQRCPWCLKFIQCRDCSGRHA